MTMNKLLTYYQGCIRIHVVVVSQWSCRGDFGYDSRDMSRDCQEESETRLHPGIKALQTNITTVRKELEGLRHMAHDYEGGAGKAGKWQMSELLQFGKQNAKAIEKCPVTWECVQHFDLEHSFGEVFVSTLKPYGSLHIHTGW